MARIESMERQAEKDREAKLAQIEGDKEAKLATEIELEKLKYSFERRYDDLKGQMNLQRAVFKVELEKQKAEKAVHARHPKLPYFDESKDKMDSDLSRFEKYATANEWKKSVWAAYLSALLKGHALDVYDRLSVDDAADYEKLKEALLKNFDMTKHGFAGLVPTSVAGKINYIISDRALSVHKVYLLQGLTFFIGKILR